MSLGGVIRHVAYSTSREKSKKTREGIGGKIDLLRSDLGEYVESNPKSIGRNSGIKGFKKAGIM